MDAPSHGNVCAVMLVKWPMARIRAMNAVAASVIKPRP
jgi:hypothetical protein